jgi:phasin family protein
MPRCTEASPLTCRRSSCNDNPPEFAAVAKAQLDTALRFATVTTESAQRLFDLNMKTVRSSFDEASAQVRAIASAKDPADVQAIAGKVLKPGLDKSQAYAKEVYESVAGVQAEVTALIETQVTEFQKQMVVAMDSLLKNAPAGSERSCPRSSPPPPRPTRPTRRPCSR